jgi:hypothetical protein
MNTDKLHLDRDARAGQLISRLASQAVLVPPERRETLLTRAERLAAYRRRFWTPERYRKLIAAF